MSEIFIIGGFAGSGKDTVSEKIGSILGNVRYVAFADRFKRIIADNLPDRFYEKYIGFDGLEILDRLKNDDINEKVFANLNMREFLKVLLGGVVRDIDKDMHCVYACEELYKIISESPNANIVVTDNRYINEQNYLLSINSLDSVDDKLDFLLSQIKNLSNRVVSFSDMSKVFEKHLIDGKDLNDDDWVFFEKIRADFFNTIRGFREYKEPNRLYDVPNWDNVLFDRFSQNDFLRYGVIRVFRPIVNDSFYGSDDELVSHIHEFSGLSVDDSLKIIENYKNWGLGLDEMKKYGFCRTNPTSPSEIELVNAGRGGYVLVNNYKDGMDALHNKVSELLDNFSKISDGVKKKDQNKTKYCLGIN